MLNVDHLVATLKQTKRSGRPRKKRMRDVQTPHATPHVHGLTGLPVEAMAGKGASRRKRSRKPKTNSKITLTGRQYIGKYLLKFFRKSVTYQTPAGWYKGTVLHVRDINNELRFQTAYFTGRGQYLEEVSFEVLEQAMKYWEAARHEWKGTAHVQLHYNLIFCINYNILCVYMCHRSDG